MISAGTEILLAGPKISFVAKGWGGVIKGWFIANSCDGNKALLSISAFAHLGCTLVTTGCSESKLLFGNTVEEIG